MEQIGSLTKSIIGTLAIVIMLFALGACGPRVVSGDENAVVIENGPWYPRMTGESSAQSHCERYGKRASYAGGQNELGTLQYTYRFDCVAGS